jgi:hypothetical protein
MMYRRRCTEKMMEELGATNGVREVFRDFFDGSDYIKQVREKNIKDNDMVLVLSLDGAQLYRNKASDAWIYIWVILDQAPDVRYQKKNVLIGAVIPGPNKPINIESFLFPGLQHLAAIQKDGLKCWNGGAAADEPEKDPK